MKHCFQSVQICVDWDLHLWALLLMTYRVSITCLWMIRMVRMGVVYHQFLMDQQVVRFHGSICSHRNHHCSLLGSSNHLSPHTMGTPLPPSSPPSSRHSHSPLSYKNPSPRMPSQDISPPRYQMIPPGPRVHSPWRDTYVPPAPSRLWQVEDDWTPYQRWAYGKATPEDNHLRETDPSIFWPDMLIGDQFLNSEQRAEH